MFFSDIPIHYMDEDLLNRKEFSKILGKSILNYKQKECLVIGLLGEWGSGKSSIINMSMEYINNLSIESEKHVFDHEKVKKPNIMTFNPWNFSNQENLILQFFIELENALIKEKSFPDNSIEFLRKYALRITLDIALIATKGNSLKDYVDMVLKKSGIENYLEEDGISSIDKDSLEEIKYQLNQSLSQINHKIIIIIDDIDRLFDKEIKSIFQLVKSIADFPNIIYILSFDKKMVIKSLNNIKLSEPEIFIEKIMQIPIEVPKLSTFDFEEFCYNELEKIYKEHDIKLDYKDRYVLYSNIKPFFNHMRDFKRYCNILNFYLPLAKEELFIPDFIILLAIQLFEHSLFLDIRDKKDFLTGTYEGNIGIGHEDKEKGREIVNKMIKPKTKITEGYKKSLLTVIFPKVEETYYNILHSYGHAKWRKDGRICDEENFDKYFNFTVPEKTISNVWMNKIIENIGDFDLFTANVLSINEKNMANIFLRKLEDYTSDISYENISIVVCSLMDIGDLLNEEYEGMFGFGINTRISRVFHQLFSRVKNQEDRFKILQKSFLNSKRSISIIVKEIFTCYYDHGKYGYKEEKVKKDEDRIVNQNQLKILENLAYEKIKDWANNGNLIRSKDLTRTLFLWEKLGNDSEIKQFLNKHILNLEGLYYIIKSYESKQSSTVSGSPFEKITYKININSMEKYLNMELIEKEVNEHLKSQELNNEEKKLFNLFLQCLDEQKLHE